MDDLGLGETVDCLGESTRSARKRGPARKRRAKK